MSLKPKRVDFNSTWKDLKETVKGVITFSNVPRAVWNDRFSDVYSLCVAYPEPLADKLYAETKKFLEEHVAATLTKVRSGGEQNLLGNYHDAWEEFSRGIDYLHMLYSYLNNQHIRKQKISEAELNYGSLVIDHAETMKEIGELGLDIWRRQMIEPLKDELVRLLLDGIKYDRLGSGSGSTERTQFQSDSTIKGVISSFVEVEEYKKKGNLDLYEEIFESAFLKATGEYYTDEASKLLQAGTISQYMERVIQRIDSENVRSRKFLYPSSYTKVTFECEQRMVGDHLPFLHSECKGMVEREEKTDLGNMYRLLKPISGAQQVLLDEVQAHIKQQGLQAISGLKGENVSNTVWKLLT